MRALVVQAPDTLRLAMLLGLVAHKQLSEALHDVNTGGPVLPIPCFDPREGTSLRDLGKGLKELLVAARHDPNIASLLRGRKTQRADLSRASVPRGLLREMERHGLLKREGNLVTLPFQIRLVEDSVIVTDHRMSNWRAEELYLDPLWGGPTFNKLLLRGPRIDRGLRFFVGRLLRSLKDRSNGFDVTSVSRGWLVLKKGEPLAFRVPLDYVRLSKQLSADFGDVLVRLLFASRGRIGPDDLRTLQIARPEVLADCLRRMEAIGWS